MPIYRVEFPTKFMIIQTPDGTRSDAVLSMTKTISEFIAANVEEVIETRPIDPDEVVVGTSAPIQEMV